ncbi:hypothetical protein ACFOSR_01460 [Aquamicrobium ahrensii]
MSDTPKTLDYRHLEVSLHEAVGMSEIACQLVEGLEHPAAKRDGGLVITDNQLAMVTFAVFHAHKLIQMLDAKWDEIRKSDMVKGGAK